MAVETTHIELIHLEGGGFRINVYEFDEVNKAVGPQVQHARTTLKEALVVCCHDDLTMKAKIEGLAD